MTLTNLCTCGHPALDHVQEPGDHPCMFVWGDTTVEITDGTPEFDGDQHCECEAYIELCPKCKHAKTSHETQPVPGTEGTDGEGNPGYYQVDPQKLLLAQRRLALADEAKTVADAELAQAEAYEDELSPLAGLFATLRAAEKVRVAQEKADAAAAEQVSATEAVEAAEAGDFVPETQIVRWGDCWRVKADGTVCGCSHYATPPSAADNLGLWGWATATTESANAGLFNFYHLGSRTPAADPVWQWTPEEGS